MKHLEISQICAKHKRKMNYICRNIDQCGCCYKLFCERCVSALKKNTQKKVSKDNENLFEIPHDFEQYEDFKNKIDQLQVTDQNYHKLLRQILNQFKENELFSKQLKRRISLDLFVSQQLNNNFLSQSLENDNQKIMVSQINLKKTNFQKANQLKLFYSDKIVQKYSNILQGILSEKNTNNKSYKHSLTNQFCSIQGKYVKQHKFDGIERQFPKYFIMQNRFLYVFNQEQIYFSEYDLSLGVELPRKIVFPDCIKIPNKSKITPLFDTLIAVHHQKILYIVDIQQPLKYNTYVFKDLIQNITPFGKKSKKIIVQFKGRLELWKYQLQKIKCLKRYFHPAIQYQQIKCLIIQNTKKIIWNSAFSLLNIDIITGEIKHYVCTREYIDFNPNCHQQNIDELINDILAQSIGFLRKFSIQDIKKINDDQILIQYQDYIEIRTIKDFTLIQRIENISCETISIIYGNILMLTKSKEKTNIQVVDQQTFSIQQLFSSKELYTKAIYCDSKLYLIKHTYFEVSNRNSYYNTLVIDMYV